MSLLSPDRLLVSLEPAAVRWVRLAGPFTARIAQKRAVEANPAFGLQPWHGAVDALRRAAQDWRGERLRVGVVLSNHFVRYGLIQPSPEAAGSAEELALARFHFVKTHGERAKSWELRLAPARAGAPRLACAIDAGLLEALKDCFPKAGRARLASLQPYLMSAFNLWRARLPKDGGWLLLPETGRACLALHAGGQWRTVQNARGDFSTPEDWEALLEREKLRAAIDPVPRTVLVRADPRSLGAARGWTLTSVALPALRGFLPLEDDGYAMGLTAQ